MVFCLGVSINEKLQLLAVGGNDNSCTLWDINILKDPRIRYVFPHSAAVKAVAFCPWSKSLLATGGGSKDRSIKFWHVNTGTLVNQIQTKGQVTSLIWSKRYKQLIATFGFGDTEEPTLLTMYDFPSLKPLLKVTSPVPIRALSAVSCPSESSICVAVNDETIRFYKLWDENEDIICEADEEGLYGSRLIEYAEGIEIRKDNNLR